MMVVGIIGGVALVAGGIYCLVGLSTKCLKCDQWFGRNVTKKTKIKEEQAAKDVTRSDKHYDRDGHLTG